MKHNIFKYQKLSLGEKIYLAIERLGDRQNIKIVPYKKPNKSERKSNFCKTSYVK